MRAGINLADFVNTVSLTYAKEITQKDDMNKNFFGGRGLENDLKNRERSGTLLGILNGIDYSKFLTNELESLKDKNANLDNFKEKSKKEFLTDFVRDIKKIIDKNLLENGVKLSSHLKEFNLETFLKKPLVVTIGRAAKQKLSIILEYYNNSVLIKEILKRDILFICIANGELSKGLEIINSYNNGFYLAGFLSEEFTKKAYSSADFLFMPSDFEPCGISQMIALNSGTLPIVNRVGGLNDTVIDGKTGFVFTGSNRDESKDNLIKTMDKAINLFYNDSEKFLEMRKNAIKENFSWEMSIKKYIDIYSKLINTIASQSH